MLWNSTTKQHLTDIKRAVYLLLSECQSISDYVQIISDKTHERLVLQKEIVLILRQIKHILYRPRPPSIVLDKELAMDMIQFHVALSEVKAADVVSRHLTVKVNDEEVFSGALEPNVLTKGPFLGPEGGVVHVTLVDVDNAGNESAPATLVQVLEDVFAPPAPDAAIHLVQEVFVEEPAPQPVNDVPVVEPPVDDTHVVEPVHDDSPPVEPQTDTENP